MVATLLLETLTFAPEDSGTESCPIVYEAAGRSTGAQWGRVVTGWKEQDGESDARPAPLKTRANCTWTANGRSALAARAGRSGTRRQCRLSHPRLESLQWRNVEDIEFCYLVVWSHSRCKIASIQPDSKDQSLAVIRMQQPTFTIARTKEGVRVALPDYVENAFELLDEAGEWYLDRSAKTIYYKPRPGEDLTQAQVVVSAVETLVEIRGTPSVPSGTLHLRT